MANYEAKGGAKRGFGFNAHVTVTDVDQYVKKEPPGDQSGEDAPVEKKGD